MLYSLNTIIRVAIAEKKFPLDMRDRGMRRKNLGAVFIRYFALLSPNHAGEFSISFGEPSHERSTSM